MAVNRSTLALLRRLMVSIGAEADQTTRNLARAWIRSWDELSGAWKAGLQDAVKKAADTGVWPQAWELARIERLRQAAIESEAALARLGQEAGVTVADAAGRVIGLDADFEPKLIGSQLPAAAQAEATLRAAGNILPTALNAITARTQSRIVAQTRTLAAPAAEAMRRELIKGIAVGSNPREAAARMVSRVQGAFDGGLVRATTIARTEMLDAYRATSQYAHAANADVVTSWIWHAQLDKRTCPSCWSQHGTEYPLTLPGPWDHPQGRCARLPKTKSWRDLGFDIDEPADDLVHAETKFWSLPADERRAIMGRGRLDLLSSGRIKWDDLSSVRSASDWRPSYTPRSVKDLQTTARLRAAGHEPPATPGVPRSLSKVTGPASGPAGTGGDPSQFVQLRPSLAAANSTRRVEKAFTDEAERITGRRVPIDLRGQDVQTAREHAEGLLRGLEQFPDVKVNVSRAISIPSGTYAQTTEPNWITFNLRHASPEGRQLYLDKLIQSTRNGFHLPGVDNPAGVAAHEFGHALAFQYGLEAIARDVSRVISDMAARAGVHPVQLVERTLGRYATKHLQEAVGEAFSDVIMNGARATELSKRIFAVMRAQYGAGPFPTTGFRTLAKATDSASTRAAQRAAVRARAAEIEKRAGIADTIGEFDELLYKQAGQPVAAVQALLRDRLSLATLDDATRKVLQRAIDTGDVAKIRSALSRTRTKFGLKPVGRAGQKVRFDDALHTSVGRDPGDGAMVTVIRQGHSVDLDGSPVQLFKAKVTPVVAPAKKAAKKAAPKKADLFPSRKAETAREIMDSMRGIDTASMSRLELEKLWEDLRGRLAKIVEGDFGGIRARLRSDTYGASPDQIILSGDLVNAQGRKIGTFSRNIGIDRSDGELVAHHGYLEIGRSYRGSGFADKFNGNLYDWYRRSGVTRVELMANIDVGGYAWATKGFEFENIDRATEFLIRARETLEKALKRTPKGLTRQQVRDLNAYIETVWQGDTPARALEIAQFGRQPGQGGKDAIWPGKWLMLKNYWYGVKYL